MSVETKGDVVDSYPLSPMQQGMLFHYLREPHSGVDIQQLVLHLPEVIDPARLEKAWCWLVKRHDILRARFVWDEGPEQPRQEIRSDVVVPFSFEDIHQLSSTDQEQQVWTFLAQDRVAGIDLDRAPLMRLTLLRKSEASYLLIWTFHHAILDGRCYPVLLKEVFEVYEELLNETIEDRPAPYAYRRFIDWLATLDLAKSKPFWSAQLGGFTSPTPLVVDRLVQPDQGDYRQGEIWDGLEISTTAALKDYAGRHGLTINSFLMGAWAMLLHRYSGEEDIVFGATRACRKASIEHADETIGVFINTVPIRAKITGATSAIETIRALRQQWVDIRPYEQTPLSYVKPLSKVAPAQPLFESLLVFENQRLDKAMGSLGGAWARRRVELHELTNFPVTVAAYDGDALTFKIEFDRLRIDEATVGRLAGHLRRLLEGLAGNPEMAVRDLPLLTEAEQQELISGFNQTKDEQIVSETTIHELFERQVSSSPHAIAMTFEGQSLTYEELNRRANQLAHYLKKHGVGRGVFVGLCLERSIEMVVGLLGVLKAGGAYVPIDPEYPVDRVRFMIHDAAVPVLMVQSQFLPLLSSYNGSIVCLDRDWEQIVCESAERSADRTGPDDLAYMIYTSGSTGNPKGAMNAHRGICNRLLWMQKQYRLDKTDVVLQKTPFSFDVSVWEFFWPLLVGARLVLAKPGGHRDPAYLVDVIEAERVTIMHFVPSMLGAFLAVSGLDRCRSLRHVMCSGEALPFNLQEEFFARLPAELHNLYGPTEAAVDVTHWTCRRHDTRHLVPIGRPVANTQMYILDRHLQPVPIGVPGDLYIGGIQVGKGYHNRPELTSEQFLTDHLGSDPGGRLYKTGDLARFLPDGEIEYIGRSDFQVKIRGFRIELGEIEAVLCRHPAIREAVVVAREDIPGVKRLVAYLVSSLSEADLDAIRSHLKGTLPEFMVPAAFVFMETLPLSPNGKIDRKALPAPARDQEALDSYTAPRTSIEQKLVDIWSRVLRVERVGIHDNFFELGGDSILSIQAISLARREGVKITPTLLFANQTIAELAAVAISTEEVKTAEHLAVGEVILTPIQRWFFEQQLVEPHHFNQAVLLDVIEPLDQIVVKLALNELSRQHDALRLRFHDNGGEWQQYYSDGPTAPVLHWVDLSAVDRGMQRQQIEEKAAAMQAGLQLDQGPIWQVAYFDLGTGNQDRLLFVIHHLAVDGISWRILIEDFESAYRQLHAKQVVKWPAKTISYKVWAERLVSYAKGNELKQELPYWQAVTDHESAKLSLKALALSGEENREGRAQTLTMSLSVQETDALLKQIAPVYNTQINDVLLTALVQAWGRWSQTQTLLIDLEGHGREDLFGEIDSTRTVGWFTSIFPVRFICSDRVSEWQPGETLKAVKEQLRAIPRRGVGYGLLRYLSGDSSLIGRAEPAIIFNYFGQFDQMLVGSQLFRFGQESSGPWRSPKQRRRYAIEINCMVLDGKFEARWTYPEHIVGDKRGIQPLADEYMAALRQVIAHCLLPEAGGRTPSDFPLANLNQSSLDKLLADQHDVEDIYPLSPIQTLFYSANQTNAGTTFDQWHCTLDGSLQVQAFQRAWQETIQRHSVLRSSMYTEGLREPLQVVHRKVQLPWVIQDWRGTSAEQINVRWQAFLQQDLSCPIDLTQAPTMRFSLVRVGEHRWKFAWSVPALLLDGWSWPLVFRDVSRRYEALLQGQDVSQEPVRPYRDYVEWLKQHPQDLALMFWEKKLAGVFEPTAITKDPKLEGEPSVPRYIDQPIVLSEKLTAKLQATARRCHVTLNTLVQAGWAIQLSRQSGTSDVVFGASFSARPTDLVGSEMIVGPFVNNVPIRIGVDASVKIGDFLRQLHGSLLELNPYQFTPLAEIQRVSAVPWRYRLFDSLVVFQNYLVDESARRFGTHVTLSDFSGPIHTSYPILLLAEPGTEFRITLVCDSRVFSKEMRARWANDVARVFEQMPDMLERAVAELHVSLSPPPGGVSDVRPGAKRKTQNLIPPQTKMEQLIADVWGQMFGMEQVSIDDNFFDIGGHSMLLVRMHVRLREALNLDFPIVTLLQHPSIRSLARCFEQPVLESAAEGDRLRDRAKKQKEALDRSRSMGRKR